MNRKIAGSFSLFAAAIAVVASAHGADPQPSAPPTGEGYAVLAAIGDQLSVVRYRLQTGSRIDQNARQVVPLPGGQMDLQAVRYAGAALHRAAPDAALYRVVGDQSILGDNEDLLTSDARRKALVTYVSGKAKDSARYLVLITKHRAEARIRLSDSSVGGGRLSGLGFYIDYDQRLLTTSETRAVGTGMISPYAYVQVALIDLKTGEVVRTASRDETMPMSTVRNPDSTDPWEVLTPEEKVRALNQLIEQAIDAAIPQVVPPA